MKVGEFLERLNRGETVTGMGEKLGLHRKTLQRRLKKLGYVWDADRQQWLWEEEKGREPLHQSLTEVNTKWQPEHTIHLDSHNVNQGDEQGSAGFDQYYSPPFTQDEIEGLKQLLAHWRETALSTTVEEVELIERIKAIKNSKNPKVRKTIVIDEEIANVLDEYAETKRVNKSDLLHLAILELVEKYR